MRKEREKVGGKKGEGGNVEGDKGEGERGRESGGGGGAEGGGIYKRVHVNCMRMRRVNQVLALAIVIRI